MVSRGLFAFILLLQGQGIFIIKLASKVKHAFNRDFYKLRRGAHLQEVIYTHALEANSITLYVKKRATHA